MLLVATGIVKRYGGFTALNNVHVTVGPAERLGLIGPNGSGKSTLVNVLAGALKLDAGAIAFDGVDVHELPAHRRTHLGLARSFQLPRLFRSMTVLGNMLVPAMYASPLESKKNASQEAAEEESLQILRSIGLAAKVNAMASSLTLVEMRKLELARAMASHPKLLIADEAMAGLSESEVDEVLDELLRFNSEGVAIVMIEHIMRAMMRFSQRLVVLVAGEKIAEGDPADVIQLPAVEKAYLGE